MENKTQHKKEKSIELRSEKVRDIVGQIPSLLIRQGILIIGLVLLVLLGISAFIPYKKTLPIEVTIQRVPAIEKIYAPADGTLLFDNLPKNVETNQIVGKLLYKEDFLPIKVRTKGKLVWNVQNNDVVKTDSLLGVVIPKDLKNIYGECEVNMFQKAQLKIGQRVEFTDDFGQQIKGQILKIYPTPIGENLFKVRIEISNVSLFGNKLSGRVILTDDSVLNYLIRTQLIKKKEKMF